MSSAARTTSHRLRALTIPILRAAVAVALLWRTGTPLTGCGSCASATVTIHGDPSPTAPSPCTTPGGLNSYSCSCSCLSGTSQVFGPKGIQVCAPSANNGCTGGTNPTPTSVSDDCHGRVQQTLQGMVRIVTNPEAMCT